MTNIGSVLVRGGTVCDPAAGHARQADVLIQDGIIQEVGPELPPPSGVRIVEAAGGYVIPGLIDAHVHVTAGTADLGSSSDASPFYVAAQTQAILGGMLRRGFTTVRDMGGADFGVAQAVADGLWEGPRVFFGGKALSPTGGHADLRGPGRSLLDQHVCCPTIGRVCDGVDAVRTGARDQFRTGADHIKVMLSGGVASPTDRIDSLQFSDDEVRAVVEEARNANRYVAGHAYTARAVNRGVRLGVRTIEHGNLIDDESVQLLVEHHAYLVPTLVTYQYLHSEGAEAGLPAASQAKVETVLHAGLSALERAHRGGVNIAFGTDLLGNMHHHQSDEFRIRAQVVPSMGVLRSATTTAAALLGKEGELGVVAPGATGDVVVVEANPLQDVAALADHHSAVRTVVQGGVVRHTRGEG